MSFSKFFSKNRKINKTQNNEKITKNTMKRKI